MLGGSFFPFEAMPGWMASVGRWTPNGIVLERFKAVLLGGADVGSLWAIAALAGVGAALFVAAAARHQRFARGLG